MEKEDEEVEKKEDKAFEKDVEEGRE